MKTVKERLMTIAVAVGFLLLLPLTATAVTTQPSATVLPCGPSNIAYDSVTVHVVPESVLPGAATTHRLGPSLDAVAGLIATDSTGVRVELIVEKLLDVETMDGRDVEDLVREGRVLTEAERAARDKASGKTPPPNPPEPPHGETAASGIPSLPPTPPAPAVSQ